MLYLATLLNSLLVLLAFLLIPLDFLPIQVHAFCKNNFTYLFPNWMPFIYFSQHTRWARNFSTTWRYKIRCLWFLAHLWEKAFRISKLIMLSRLIKYALYQMREFHFYFYQKWILKGIKCLVIYNYICNIHFIYIMHILSIHSLVDT